MNKPMTASEVQLRMAESARRLVAIRDAFMQPIVDRMTALVERHTITGEWSLNRYPFRDGPEVFYDWGHYCRANKYKWSWVDRVIAWNPCNHIAQLRGFY